MLFLTGVKVIAYEQLSICINKSTVLFLLVSQRKRCEDKWNEIDELCCRKWSAKW